MLQLCDIELEVNMLKIGAIVWGVTDIDKPLYFGLKPWIMSPNIPQSVILRSLFHARERVFSFHSIVSPAPTPPPSYGPLHYRPGL
jgi:hypothetical protein